MKTTEEKKEIKKIIIKELEKLKDSMRLVVCNKTYNKYQLIEGVKKENEIGKFMIKLRKNYVEYYNKKNNNLENLISLCRNCHSQTNYNREDWENYFMNKVQKETKKPDRETYS